MLIGALEAGGTKMVCSIGNPEGGVLQRASFPTLTPDVTIPQIVDFIGKFDVKALGIGSFGPLDLNPASPTYGSITKTPKTDWIDYPLLSTLQEALGVPVIGIGVPTVVGAGTIVHDAVAGVLESLEESEMDEFLGEVISPALESLYVTTKEIDEMVRRLAGVLAAGMNQAFSGEL